RRPTRRFVFYPAQLVPYKNHRLLVEMLGLWAKRRPDRPIDLVVTGHSSEGTPDGWDAGIQRAGVVGRGHAMATVPQPCLGALYATAHAVMVPSLYEQGSYPLLEALRAGCPVASSDIPTLREQGGPMGDAMLYFNPLDPEAAYAALAKIDADRDGIIRSQQ